MQDSFIEAQRRRQDFKAGLLERIRFARVNGHTEEVERLEFIFAYAMLVGADAEGLTSDSIARAREDGTALTLLEARRR